MRHERVCSDLILGRVFKFCLFLQNLKKIAPAQLDKDFFNFKQDLEKDIRNEERRSELLLTCRTIHLKQSEIMSTPMMPDFLEEQGFKYNPATFGDLFGTGWQDTFADGSDDSSDEEEKATGQGAEEKEEKDGFGEEILTGSAREPEPNSQDELSSGGPDSDPEPVEEPIIKAAEIDINMIEPSKVNWFKYIIDKYLVAPEDGSPNLLNSTDAYANLLTMILSQKKNEEVTEDLLDLVGFHNFELLQQLLEKREFIKEYCKVCEEHLKKEKQSDNYRANYSMNAPNKQAFLVEHTVQSKGKGGKRKVI